MMYIADPKDKRPAYLQLYSQIKDDIVSGVFPFQGKLPSKRIMAGDSGLSTITVKHAYQLLCDEGYIESRERSGYFVIFRSGDGFISTENKSLAAYLRQLASMGENPDHYRTLWSYRAGETEPRFALFEYPDDNLQITSEITHIASSEN